MIGRRGHHGLRGGFTLLELLLAMTLGAMVVAGGFGLIVATERMDRSFATRLERSNQMAFVQRTIARSLQSIVAAPAEYDPQVAAQAAAEAAEQIARFERLSRLPEAEREAAREAERRARLERERAEALGQEIPEGSDVPARLDARGESRVAPAPPRLRLGHLSKGGEWEDRGSEAGEGVRRLELLLAAAPVGPREPGPPIRGALDLVPTGTGTEERWRLQWTPIRPAGKPTILLEDLVLAEWSATDSRGQFDQFAAYEQSELPWAVRFILWTEDGLKVDWMFDLGVASTTGDPL